jgi:hypothetical protein
MKHFRSHLPALLLGALLLPVAAEERTMTPEQMEELAKNGDLTEESTERPATLPDLTKGDPIPASKDKPEFWYLGPTGIIGIMVGGFGGDQIQVQTTLKGSPAEGKFQLGDVITGMNGMKFIAGKHLGYLIGNAIIDAEREENGGKLTFQVWRDENYPARFGKKDVTSVDIDKMFDEAQDDNSLFDWKPEEERKKEVLKMDLDKFPMKPSTLEVALKIRVFPAYSDTSPYDCPKANQILEDAWKVVEKKFVVDPKDSRSGRGGVVEAMALIASGKPEHRKIVHDWVRTPKSPWAPPTEPIGAMFQPGFMGGKGFRSWYAGYNGLNCALYYDATGDDYVLPALKKFAVETAMGQSGGGSWGHTFAFPSFNGGEFHKMNPGYGAVNAAGNRCFFLITLAQKLGIKDPEIDAAVVRAHSFFGSYVDQGCIPYGDHPAYGSDDSNGKNTGVAFSMKLLGDNYGAKYFAQMSTHASFTARGGHGHDYHTNWSRWASNMCGPEGVIVAERNMRWRRTLCRMYDGSFVYHSPTGGKYKALRDPTATEVLHYAVPLKQTLITGKDPDEELWSTEREMKQLLSSARGQFNDPTLLARDGKPWPERSTDEIFDLLDIFYPKARAAVAAELGKRFQAGETEIAPRLVKLLEDPAPRYRDGACLALLACGTDTVLSSLSPVTRLLDDPSEFVRITAIQVISKCTETEETQLAMLNATVADPTLLPPNSVRNSTQTALFAKDNGLANNPFEAGFEDDLVRKALEDVLLLDPAGKGFLSSRQKTWTKETAVRLAGPLTYIAEEEQINDQMFAGRSAPAVAMLGKFGYKEALEASANLLRKQAAIPRDIRPYVGFKRPLMDPDTVRKQPAAFRDFIDPIKTVLTDDPLARLEIKVDKKVTITDLDDMLSLIEAEKESVTLPSIADDVRKLFRGRLDAADGTGAKLKVCRAALGNPTDKSYFRMMAAMDFLTETLGADALEDLVPYLGHEYWRVRDHSRKLASGLLKTKSAAELAALLSYAPDASSKAGFLNALALSTNGAGLELAKNAMNDGDPAIRQAAITTAFTLGGDKTLPDILVHLKQARQLEDLRGCEDALLSSRDDASHAARVRDAIIAMLPGSDDAIRPSLYYLLARIGDPQSIAVLKKACTTDSLPELDKVAFALSYSPSREADKVLLELAATDVKSAAIAGKHSVRRMVLGPKGFGDVTGAEKMDFAEAMLKLALDRRLVAYLGHIHEARALRALMFCLEKGVSAAAESLVHSAEGMDKLSTGDAKIAAKALQDVIEYIEITRLRGGVAAHMDKDDKYTEWKLLQARAGKVLLKIHKPETAPIPGFDSLDLE